ncbi:MAG: DotA/TraY family protein [Methylotenera sp.]|nr:DotA/TraY family protein [Methylotenera sp.]
MLKIIDTFFTKLDKINKRKLLILFVLWTIFCAYAVGNAHAGEPAPAQITTDGLAQSANSANDPNLSAIGAAEKLFGTIVQNPISMIGSPNTILGNSLALFNAVLMAIGAVWVTWSVAKGSLMTAHEGQFIGKSMHSAWVPFRLVIGAATLVPIFKGLCAAQLVALFVIQLGIGAGNMMWSSAVGFIDAGNQIVGVNGLRASTDLSQQVFSSLLCVKSVNYGLNEMGFEAGTYSHGLKINKYVFGNSLNQDESCGSFELPAKGSTALSIGNYNMRLSAFYNLVKSIEPEAERVANGYYLASTDPVNHNLPVLNPNFLKTVAAQNQEELRIGTASLFKIANEGTDPGQLLNSAKNSAQTQGFFTAGTYFFAIAHKSKDANEAISLEVKLAHSANPPNSTIFEGVDSIYRKTELATRINQERQGAGANDDSWTWNKIKMAMCGSASNLQLTLGQCIVQSTINIGDQNQSAIIRLSQLGNSIVAGGAGGITAVGAAQGALDGAENSVVGHIAKNPITGGLAGAGKIWLSIAASGLELLMVFGLVCASYVPLIPAIIWIMRMVSIIAMWVEAVVSSSVWAFSHFDTDGEGMGSRSGHGYWFMFAALLNPMLSVLGLILSMVALQIMSTFVLLIYPDMIANSAGENWTGLLMIVAYLIIFVTINLGLVNTCCQLINVVPDNILDWVGGKAGQSLGRGKEDFIAGAAKGAVGGMIATKSISSWTPKKQPPKAEPKKVD